MTKSGNWPGVAPGSRGILSALSGKYCPWADIVDIEPKPPILWTHGSDDIVVADGSVWEMGTLGRAEMVPGWPGTEIFPPQEMVGQIRDAPLPTPIRLRLPTPLPAPWFARNLRLGAVTFGFRRRTPKGEHMIRRIGLGATVIAGLVALFAGAALADHGEGHHGETMELSKSENLMDGEVVTVILTSFLPGNTVTLVTCYNYPALGPADCNLANYGQYSSDVAEDGTASIDYQVDVIDGRCDQDTSCFIVAADGFGSDANYAAQPITFAAGATSAQAPADETTDEAPDEQPVDGEAEEPSVETTDDAAATEAETTVAESDAGAEAETTEAEADTDAEVAAAAAEDEGGGWMRWLLVVIAVAAAGALGVFLGGRTKSEPGPPVS